MIYIFLMDIFKWSIGSLEYSWFSNQKHFKLFAIRPGFRQLRPQWVLPCSGLEPFCFSKAWAFGKPVNCFCSPSNGKLGGIPRIPRIFKHAWYCTPNQMRTCGRWLETTKVSTNMVCHRLIDGLQILRLKIRWIWVKTLAPIVHYSSPPSTKGLKIHPACAVHLWWLRVRTFGETCQTEFQAKRES